MFSGPLKTFQRKWRSYRHRFLPWVVFNLSKNEKTLRHVTERSEDSLISAEQITQSLLKFFIVLLKGYNGEHRTSKDKELLGHNEMFQTLGFCIDRRPSTLPFAGTGVFVVNGVIPKGTVVAMYPGTVYQPYDPILFQSIRNPFIFRCIDGVLIDGNDKGMSKMVFKSCSGRDRLGPLVTSDTSWLTASPRNPLAVGQYVNNCSNTKPANVCYQEYDVPDTFPIELWQFLPNVNFSQDARRPLRCVVLVSFRDIAEGEELFSNYYTIVH
uniref:SET domain containing 9 n=1 Tax=Oryzias latipes TaxID=8090 RepID=A0A3P9HJH4_ORYLA